MGSSAPETYVSEIAQVPEFRESISFLPFVLLGGVDIGTIGGVLRPYDCILQYSGVIEQALRGAATRGPDTVLPVLVVPRNCKSGGHEGGTWFCLREINDRTCQNFSRLAFFWEPRSQLSSSQYGEQRLRQQVQLKAFMSTRLYSARIGDDCTLGRGWSLLGWALGHR